jgi:hypothetical protein
MSLSNKEIIVRAWNSTGRYFDYSDERKRWYVEPVQDAPVYADDGAAAAEHSTEAVEFYSERGHYKGAPSIKVSGMYKEVIEVIYIRPT